MMLNCLFYLCFVLVGSCLSSQLPVGGVTNDLSLGLPYSRDRLLLPSRSIWSKASAHHFASADLRCRNRHCLLKQLHHVRHPQNNTRHDHCRKPMIHLIDTPDSINVCAYFCSNIVAMLLQKIDVLGHCELSKLKLAK